jgi:putative DNA primase/helicase
MNKHLDGALAWWDAGMCVIPARSDGSKRPVHEWKSFMGVRPPRGMVANWYTERPDWGVGIVCGQISGNLEMLEIEAARMDSASHDRIRDAMDAQGDDVSDMWSALTDYGYCEFTPSGGIHILYRIADQPVPGNQKIAMSEDSKATYAETRGEGGFVIVAPSSGTVHPSGESWDAAGQSYEGQQLRTITWEMRCKLHTALKVALDERVLPTYERPAGVEAYDRSQGDRPGDAFNDDPSVSIHDILTRNGWKWLGRKQGQDEYVHPNSSDMTTGSARTGHQGSPNLYAWSGMPQEGSYDKFAVLTHLEYGGDFSAASAALRKLGYGAVSSADGMDDWNTEPSVGVDQATVEGVPAPVESPTLKGFNHTDVAEFAKSYLLSKFRYVTEERGWRYYFEGRWMRDTEKAIDRAAQRVARVVKARADEFLEKAKQGTDKEEISAAKAVANFGSSLLSNRGTKDLVETFARISGVAVSANAFDRNLNLLVLANGTFDLETMELREHRSEDMLTKRIDVAYDADATAPMWMKAWGEIMPDSQLAEYVQTGVGMTAWGSTREAAFFLLHGDSGCGKSLFLSVMEAATGEYAATATASALRTSRYSEKTTTDLHALKGARFVSTSETSEATRLDEELIKRITGGDRITSRALYQDNVTWRPTFTMWMATNHLPQISAEDNAIWRRVKPIHFPVSFFKDGRTADVGLAERIIKNELPGVLNWIIEGARRYAKDGLVDPINITSAVSSYREDIDPVRVFLTEAANDGRIRMGPEASIKSVDLYRVYVAFCTDNSIHPMGELKFARRMTAAGYEAHKGTNGVRMRLGIEVNPAYGYASAQKSSDKYW